MNYSESDIIDFCNSGFADAMISQLRKEMSQSYDADKVFFDIKEKLHNNGLTVDVLKGSELYESFVLFEKMLASTYFVERYFKNIDISELKKYISRFVFLLNGYS